eukprot:747421-Hanusia_phi.AAC.6
MAVDCRLPHFCPFARRLTARGAKILIECRCGRFYVPIEVVPVHVHAAKDKARQYQMPYSKWTLAYG